MDKEVRDVMLTMAGYYAALCEREGGNFDTFGADSIHHCYEYCELVDGIEVPYTEDGLVDTETLRETIYHAIFEKYGLK